MRATVATVATVANRPVLRRRPRRRLQVDGYELVVLGIEPDPWNWVGC